MPDLQGRVIDTREELIAALELAAELEHGLLVQYLYAAMSVRNHPVATGDANAWRTHEVVRSIQVELYKISHEEMAHLATVSNLLMSIGAAPHLTRPFMEDVRTRLQDRRLKPILFRCEQLNEGALKRFRNFEARERIKKVKPQVPPPPPRGAPDVFDIRSVGALYRLIREGFATLGAGGDLFVGAAAAQDRFHWGMPSLRITPVADVLSAQSAIDFIIAEGEGSPPRSPAQPGPSGSHYDRLKRMLDRFRRESATSDLSVHMWPVVPNPATLQERRHSKQVSMLHLGGAPTAELRCAELCNAIYTCMLHMLAQLYDPAGESDEARKTLTHSSKQLMSTMLRPVCEVLVQIPSSLHAGHHAGPPFEIYGDVHLPGRPQHRFTLLVERISRIGEVATSVADDYGLARLHEVAYNAGLLSRNLLKTIS